MAIDPVTSKASLTTLEIEEFYSPMRKQNLSSSVLLDPDLVMDADPKTLESEASIQLTSAYPEVSTSKQKADSPPPTGPSLLLSDPNIPPSTYVSSSKPTIGPQSLNGNAIPGGQASTGSSGTSVKQCQGIGRMHLDGAGYCQTCVPQPFGKPLFFHDSPYVGMTEHRASAMDHQVGGDHYRKLSIQPVEFIHKNGLGFLAGNVIKYVCRYKAKAGVQDLLKAKHYIEMLIEQERQDP